MHCDPSGASRLRKLLLLATAAALAALTTACGSSDSTADANDASGFPVTVSTCGHSATFQAPPKRAVATDVNMTEDMLALDLGDRLIGTFAVGDNTHKIGDQYRDAWNQIKHVSSDYPKLEPLVGLKPDFVFTGWAWGLDESKNITPDNLAGYGIKTYILDESCDWAPGGTTKSSASSASIETTYTDLRNLGKIFGVRPKAEQVIDDMKAKIADVRKRVASSTPKKVFLYDSGDAAPFTVGGRSVANAVITLAGGTNIFADVKRSWDGSTWEKVVDAQPDCIILNEYGGASASTTAAVKEKFLKTSPITKDLPAVKNDCIMAFNFDEITPGARNAETVEKIARWLHPEAFA
ncbi:MAG TPA: ABC transporter substrate-binding protein [Baekduia sp.]|nr:ABC transporter substrate-binding protein [Baekduia sp.]